MDTTSSRYIRGTADERFWPKVTKQPGDGCWVWTAGTTADGYGNFRVGTKALYAHRWAWEQINGPVQEGSVLDHVACDNRRCVWPDHLEPTTIAANVLRGVKKAAAARTSCRRGHLRTPKNTRVYVYGNRILASARDCERLTYAARKAERLAAAPPTHVSNSEAA
jgi:hypothetical protein